MRYDELFRRLRERYEIEPVMRSSPPTIKDIRLLDGKEQEWDECVLYVGSCSRLKDPPDRPVMLLAVDDPPALPEGSNFARIREKDICELFNTAKEMVFEELQEKSIFFELAQMAMSEKSIEAIINRAAELLGNALILVDAGQKVLAHSTKYEIVDPLWAQNVRRGYCSFEFVQIVRTSSDMRTWSRKGGETQSITLPGDRQPKLVARITEEKQVVGALVMVVHHTPIRHLHHRLLPLIGRLLFIILTRHSSTGGVHSSHYSATLYNLLEDVEIADAMEYISMTGLSFPPEMRVVVARFVHVPENRYLKNTFSMQLERIFPAGHSVIYKNHIGILVPSVSEKQREDLATLAKNEDVTIGISWPFTEIADFKKHFNQGVAAIKLAHRFGWHNQVVDYGDIHYYDLLNNYTGKVPLEQFCHPALRQLRDYDRTNNTDLYTTLRTYLECNLNQCSAAKALFIHRNSLLYRLRRINQITGLDLNDTRVVSSLLDSYRIETFLASKKKRQQAGTGAKRDGSPL